MVRLTFRDWLERPRIEVELLPQFVRRTMLGNIA
jgi:hypothetical protein